MPTVGWPVTRNWLHQPHRPVSHLSAHRYRRSPPRLRGFSPGTQYQRVVVLLLWLLRLVSGFPNHSCSTSLENAIQVTARVVTTTIINVVTTRFLFTIYIALRSRDEKCILSEG